MGRNEDEETRELLGRLAEADARLTPGHVAARYRELRAQLECQGHPLEDIPLEDLRRSAAAAVAGAREATIGDFQVYDDGSDEPRRATRADLLELVGQAGSKQGLAELLDCLQRADEPAGESS